MSATITPALMAALDAAFTSGQWRTVGVQLDEHAETSAGGAEGEAPTTTINTSATLQIENATKGQILVFMLTGTDAGWQKVKLIAGGGSFDSTDAALIARLAATITPALAAMQTALVAKLTDVV